MLIIDAVREFRGAGLLIAGAAMFAGGRTRGPAATHDRRRDLPGRMHLLGLLGRANTIIWTMLFAILSIIALAFAWTKQTSEWLRVTMMPELHPGPAERLLPVLTAKRQSGRVDGQRRPVVEDVDVNRLTVADLACQ